MHRAAAFALTVILLFAAAASAQTGAGGIQGVVKDPTGAVVPQAEISAIRTETGQKFTATSNGAGFYLMPTLQPGQYKIEVRAPGMQAWEGGLVLRTGQQAVVDAELKLAATASEITVAGDVTPLVSVASATVGATVERERIEQLPLNGRNVVSIVGFTTPGIEGNASEVRVYGLRYGAMEFMQDGAVLSNRNWGYPQGRPPGLDTVAEFKVETNNASAKSNRPATTIITTRSGTNQIHGSLFETARNNGLGTARRREDYYEKAPAYIRNEYGGSLGGPVFLPKIYNGKNRTFFFFAYEASLRRQYQTQSTSMPTLAMREGDFSGLIDGQDRLSVLYDPLTTDSRTWLRTPFPGNRIPLARRSPVAAYLYSVMPAPTFNDVNPMSGSNWFGLQPNNQDQGTKTLRVDHRLSDADQVFVRLTFGDTDSVWNNGNSGSPMTLDQRPTSAISSSTTPPPPSPGRACSPPRSSAKRCSTSAARTAL